MTICMHTSAGLVQAIQMLFVPVQQLQRLYHLHVQLLTIKMKTKCLLIAAMLILLISIPIILFNAHSKSGEISKSDMISYESFKGKDELNIPLSNYRLDCPTYAYFGADCNLLS